MLPRQRQDTGPAAELSDEEAVRATSTPIVQLQPAAEPQRSFEARPAWASPQPLAQQNLSSELLTTTHAEHLQAPPAELQFHDQPLMQLAEHHRMEATRLEHVWASRRHTVRGASPPRQPSRPRTAPDDSSAEVTFCTWNLQSHCLEHLAATPRARATLDRARELAAERFAPAPPTLSWHHPLRVEPNMLPFFQELIDGHELPTMPCDQRPQTTPGRLRSEQPMPLTQHPAAYDRLAGYESMTGVTVLETEHEHAAVRPYRHRQPPVLQQPPRRWELPTNPSSVLSALNIPEPTIPEITIPAPNTPMLSQPPSPVQPHLPVRSRVDAPEAAFATPTRASLAGRVRKPPRVRPQLASTEAKAMSMQAKAQAAVAVQSEAQAAAEVAMAVYDYNLALVRKSEAKVSSRMASEEAAARAKEEKVANEAAAALAKAQRKVDTQQAKADKRQQAKADKERAKAEKQKPAKADKQQAEADKQKAAEAKVHMTSRADAALNVEAQFTASPYDHASAAMLGAKSHKAHCALVCCIAILSISVIVLTSLFPFGAVSTAPPTVKVSLPNVPIESAACQSSGSSTAQVQCKSHVSNEIAATIASYEDVGVATSDLSMHLKHGLVVPEPLVDELQVTRLAMLAGTSNFDSANIPCSPMPSIPILRYCRASGHRAPTFQSVLPGQVAGVVSNLRLSAPTSSPPFLSRQETVLWMVVHRTGPRRAGSSQIREVVPPRSTRHWTRLRSPRCRQYSRCSTEG